MKTPFSKTKIIIPILLIIVAAVGYYLYIKGLKGKKVIYSGVVEATTYDLSFDIPGRIDKIYVKEGDRVKKGTLLVTMDQETLIANMRQAEARLGAAKANLDNLLAGSRPEEIKQAQAKLEASRATLEQLRNGPTYEQLKQAQSAMLASYERYKLINRGYRSEDIKTAYSNLQAAKSNYETAKKDYERYKNLFDAEAISAQTLDYQKNKYDQALSNYNSAKENYQKMKSGFRPEERESARYDYHSLKAHYENLAAGTRYEEIKRAEAEVKYWENQLALAIAGPRADEIKAARKKVAEAEAALDLAKVQLKNSRLFAPSDGVIISRNFEPMERAGAQVSVITMADLEHPWVYIFIPEPEINKIKIGSKAVVRVDSYQDKKFFGRIVRIYEKAEFTPKFIQTQEERVNLVFKAKVELENPELLLKPGTPADVEIEQSGK